MTISLIYLPVQMISLSSFSAILICKTNLYKINIKIRLAKVKFLSPYANSHSDKEHQNLMFRKFDELKAIEIVLKS